MSYVVGLDLSLTSAGIVVVGEIDGVAAPILMRCIGEAGKKTDTYAQRSRRIRTQCRAIVECLAAVERNENCAPALAVIEGPLYGVKTLPSYFDRAGLFHGVFGALDARRVPIAVVPPTTGHQFSTGVAHADKKLIVANVSRWWPGVRIANDDIADAAALALMGAMHLGVRTPFRPGARHHN